MLKTKIVNALVGSRWMPRKARRLVLLAYGVDVHTSNIMEGCEFGGPDIRIGRGTLVRHGCSFDNNARITIGEFVGVGPETMFITSNHEVGDATQRWGRLVGEPIVVGDGTWIGSRVTILPGVEIGSGCIVPSGAIVREDCEPNCIYAGVPARRIRALDDRQKD